MMKSVFPSKENAMKKLLIPALLAACMSAPLYAEIGVTITVGEPDFY
jgi:hypothetical protein